MIPGKKRNARYELLRVFSVFIEYYAKFWRIVSLRFTERKIRYNLTLTKRYHPLKKNPNHFHQLDTVNQVLSKYSFEIDLLGALGVNKERGKERLHDKDDEVKRAFYSKSTRYSHNYKPLFSVARAQKQNFFG